MADNPATIASVEELRAWLEENGWFEGASVIALDPEPGGSRDQTPARVRLQFGEQVAGGYGAGGVRTIRIVRIEAVGVTRWDLDPSLPFETSSNRYLSDGVQLPDPEGSFGLVLDSPGGATLLCSKLVLEPSIDRVERIRPEPSDTAFSALVPCFPCPTPRQWSDWFLERGVEIAWRRYGEAAEPVEDVPADHYTGWFLQSPERVASTVYGLFFDECRVNGEGALSLSMKDYGGDSRILLECAGRIVGSLPGVVVKTGNCRLTGPQWLEYLGDGGSAYLDQLYLGSGGESLPWE